MKQQEKAKQDRLEHIKDLEQRWVQKKQAEQQQQPVNSGNHNAAVPKEIPLKKKSRNTL